jgi:hypothetical protein
VTVDGTGLPGSDPAEDLESTVVRLLGELERRLPPAVLQVERDARMADRLAGRPGRPVRVTVDTGEGRLLVLDLGGGGIACTACTRVAGVDVARRRLRLTQWLARLEAFLAEREEETAVVEAAAHRVLVTLGSAVPADALAVRASSFADDLAELPAHLTGKVPTDVVETVRRIAAELAGTHARLPPDARPAHLVHRVGTDYLPTTLRIYLELPPRWAQQHPGFGGRTALDILREQLDILETGARELHLAVLAGDADRLVANGSFLAERFGTADSELHLPEHTD